MKKFARFLRLSGLLAAGFAVTLLAGSAAADGTEELGPPSIAVETGTGLVASGTGLLNLSGSGTLTFNVPGDVKQALLYWQRHSDNLADLGATDSLVVAGTTVEGVRIGGPTLFFNNVRFAMYRADITSMVSSGGNTMSVQGVPNASDLTRGHDGAGVFVILDDGSNPEHFRVAEIRDGLDLAFCGFGGDLNAVVPQEFTFPPSTIARNAQLSMFFGSIASNRGTEVRVFVDDVLAYDAIDQLGNTNGAEWDTLSATVEIPPGATRVLVDIVSRGSRPFCASLSWVGVGLAVAPAAACGNQVVDPGEDCDGTDDDACPGACLSDCTCPSPTTTLPATTTTVPGSTTTSTTSTTVIQPPCGNGIEEGDEECDDGEDNSNTEPDACRLDCRDPFCGDGVIDTGETCDPPLDAGCGANCLLEDCPEQVEICGNGEDDDGDGQIDCFDSDCPKNIEPPCGCEGLAGDPAVIRFAREGSGRADFFKVHGNFRVHSAVAFGADRFFVMLGNEHGIIWRGALSPGDLKRKKGGKGRYVFKNPLRREGTDQYDGFYHVGLRLRERQGTVRCHFRLKVFDDFSLATEPDMTLQLSIGDDVGGSKQTWRRTNHGWILRLRDFSP